MKCYNRFVEIVIEPINKNMFKGTLFIDGQEIETTIQPRPGCCARTLMNKIMYLHGKPESSIQLNISGW